MDIQANWTGRYPNLCSGHWIITVDSIVLPLPEDIESGHMETFGTYSAWHFDENWCEQFDAYEDGLGEAEWIAQNRAWVDASLDSINMRFSEDDYRNLYRAIQAADWRHGSCGGCI